MMGWEKASLSEDLGTMAKSWPGAAAAGISDNPAGWHTFLPLWHRQTIARCPYGFLSWLRRCSGVLHRFLSVRVHEYLTLQRTFT